MLQSSVRSNSDEEEGFDSPPNEGFSERSPLLAMATLPLPLQSDNGNNSGHTFAAMHVFPTVPEESLSACLHALASLLFYITCVVGIMLVIVLVTLLWTFLLVRNNCPSYYHRFLLGSLAYIAILVYQQRLPNWLLRSNFFFPIVSLVYFYQGYMTLQPCYESYNHYDTSDTTIDEQQQPPYFCIEECKELYVALEFYLVTLVEFLSLVWMVLHFAMPMMNRVASSSIVHASNDNESTTTQSIRATAWRPTRLAVVDVTYILRQLKNVKIDENEECLMPECCICMMVFSSLEPVITTPCQHLFHKSCIERWILGKTTMSGGLSRRKCPLCRQDMAALR